MAEIEDERAIEFVKIVERFPDIYNNKNNRRFFARKAWDKVAECVKQEMKIDCTARELKTRWKGIRSSFTRYKLNLVRNDGIPPKKYYLYDSLKFLIPFTKSRRIPKETEAVTVNEDSSDNEASNSNDYDTNAARWSPVEVKSILTKNEPEEQLSETDEEPIRIIENKRKRVHSSNSGTDAYNDDLQFFKCLLPDIINFTPKEKRRFKMGVIQLIDTIENERDDSQ